MKPIHTIFYSWQSDLPKETNLNAIRQSLREASTFIESEIEDTRIEVDEATRNTSGSPNIPNTIFNKISVCDIFVCDLTTINSTTSKDIRRVQNPNVLIELGFAIAILGWERIIMVFNEIHGNFPTDLPFDIDRHRSTPFKIIDKNDKNGKTQLTKVLKDGIKAIIEKSPLKPDEKKKETPEEKKRNIDVRNLNWALNAIHIPTFDNFVEEIPERIIDKIFYFKENFVSIIESNSFHIYDQELLHKLTKLKENWIKSLSFSKHYDRDSSGEFYRFRLVMDTFQSDQAEKDFDTIVSISFDLEKDFKELLQYVRNNYLEIDIDETSRNAIETYTSIMDKIKKNYA